MAANKLSAVGVSRLSKPGRYGDGMGLWFYVKPSGSRQWVYRFALQGKTREMGIGAYPAVSLADARQRAGEARRIVLEGRDPVSARATEKAEAALAAARALTFADVADAYIEAHKAGWKNAKHRQQWRNTLDEYALPVLGKMSIGDVQVGDVMRVLEPIWHRVPETASRLRGRIEVILDYAKARAWRSGENPARWRGHIQNLLPKRSKVARPGHHAALPWTEIGDFLAHIRGRETISSRALEFLILTATRTSEVLDARWCEFDLGARVWTIPGARMKAGTEHRVPLSSGAVALLQALPREGEWVFPGGRRGKPLSNMALLVLLRRIKRSDLTVHGFRSTFRDWCGEATHYPRDVAEQALAHTLKDKTEAAYRRGDALEKRRAMMDDWATFCARPSPKGEVVLLKLKAVGE